MLKEGQSHLTTDYAFSVQPNQLGNSNGMSFDGEGHLYLADRGNN